MFCCPFYQFHAGREVFVHAFMAQTCIGRGKRKGAKQQRRKEKRMGANRSLCSALNGESRNCVLEKFEWVDEHLGKDWTIRLIPAKDKTVIRADVLIDDRPKIEGLEKPKLGTRFIRCTLQ
jgi:hypothetical protein